MSQRLIKLATSLQRKKFRDKENAFVAEGEKLILELLPKMQVRHILCTGHWALSHPDLTTTVVTDSELKKASALKTPSSALAIFEIPKGQDFSISELPALLLDTIQDPGNLGTIIRTAAWFGFQHIVCSPETVDVYNPKVVQATMGALRAVQIHYTPLESFLEKIKEQGISTFGTFLKGKSIYQTNFPKKSVVVIGNEGNGISDNLRPFINQPIHIPAFGENAPESLNASISTAIVCSEMMRTIQN